MKWTLSRKNKLSYYTRKLLLRYFKRKDLEVLATKFMAKTHYSVNVRKTLSDFYNSEIKELSQILGQNFDS